MPSMLDSRAPSGTRVDAGPGRDLGHIQALVEAPGGERGERQHRDQEADAQPAHVHRGPPDLRHQHGQHHDHREDRPYLDAAGEPERHTAPEQPPAAGGQPVAVEQGQRAQQAEEHEPRLDQYGPRGGHAVRVNGHQAAGHDHGEQAAVPDQQADQQHARRAGQGGQYPAAGHGRGRAGDLGQRRGREHQQGDPGRLDQDELLVRQQPVDQAHRAAEVGAVVVLGDAEQVPGAAQQQQPQAEGQQGADDDRRVDRGQPAGSAARRRRGGTAP